jgi:hypothetical protein
VLTRTLRFSRDRGANALHGVGVSLDLLITDF